MLDFSELLKNDVIKIPGPFGDIEIDNELVEAAVAGVALVGAAVIGYKMINEEKSLYEVIGLNKNKEKGK